MEEGLRVHPGRRHDGGTDEYRVPYALSLVDTSDRLRGYTFIPRRKRDHGHRKCEVRAKSRWYASYVTCDAIT